MKNQKNRPVGIRDIAERAKVSISAVSKVLNGYENFSVGEATRARILKAVEDLGYRPDAAARTLRRRKSDTVGLLVHSFEGFTLGLLGELEKRLRRMGLAIEVACSEFDVGRELELLRHFENRLCDGVLVITSWQESAMPLSKYLHAMPKRMPVVFIDSNLPDPGTRAVVGDNHGDAFRAVEALAARGVKRFFYVGSSMEIPVLVDRRAGFVAALRSLRLGFAASDDLSLKEGGPAMHERLLAHFRKAPAGTCTFFESLDVIANLVGILSESGRRFGEEIFLSGFDVPRIHDGVAFLTTHPGLFTRPIPYVEQHAASMVEAAIPLLRQPPGPGKLVKIPGILRHFS